MEKSATLFLFGCLPVRIALVAIAYKYPNVLPYMGYAALVVSIGFAVIYLGNLRKTGLEVFGRPIWWNDLRPVHAALYLWFALWAIKKNRLAWVPLALDVILGLVAFLRHYA